MTKKGIVTIAIPLYKPDPSRYELASFQQCLKIFSEYPICVFTYQELDMSVYMKLEGADRIVVEYFDKAFFSDVSGYNKLMLSKGFYQRFSKYTYLLIYQLDAWVFSDALLEWCSKGYDYIGGPWLNWDWSEHFARSISFSRRLQTKLGISRFKMVGNGGFSLRKTSACKLAVTFFSYAASKFVQNEDYFFSFYVPSYNPFFKIPNEREAVKFSFDMNPALALELNNNNLPMGCHGWNLYEEFWKPYIPVVR